MSDRESSTTDLSGMTLENRYLVIRELGRGGMGAVYLARDERLEREVVVKVPHAHYLNEAGFRDRFQQEVRSLIHLDHPRVVKVHDAGEHEGIPFAVLQYLRGGSLKDRMEKRPGPERVAKTRTWLHAVAEGLDFLHGRKLIHRDVKPGNILFDEDGNAFLADFGIAKALGSADTGLTMTGVTPGTPHYMAPEVFHGSKLTPGYDQYALGTVLYEVLSGTLPYAGETPLRVLYLKAQEPPPDLGERAPELPETLAAVVMRAIHRDPAARYPSCTEFAEAFAQASTEEAAPPGAPISSAATSGTEPALPTITVTSDYAPTLSLKPEVPADATADGASGVPIRRWIWGLAGLVGLALAVGLAVRDRGSEASDDPASPAALPRDETPAPAAREIPKPPAVTATPDGEAQDANPVVVTSTDPRAGEIVGPQAVLTGEASEDFARAWVNGRAAEVSGRRFTGPLENLAEGANTIEVTLVTAAGVETRHTFEILADVTPPALMGTEPETGSTVPPEFTLRGEANEILKEATVNGEPAAVQGKTFRLALRVPEEGLAADVALQDRWGNRHEAIRLVFHRDLTPPKLIEISPDEGSVVSEREVTVTGRADKPLRSILIAGDFAEVAGHNFSATLNLGKGRNDFTLALEDLYGNVNRTPYSLVRPTTAVEFDSFLALTVTRILPTGERVSLGETPAARPLEISSGERWIVEPKVKKFTPATFRELIGVVRDQEVPGLDLSRTAVRAVDWCSFLSDLPKLEHLDLSVTAFMDTDFRYIAELPALRRLHLYYCTRILGEGIEALLQLEHLEFLDLGVTNLTNPNLRKLNEMSSLRTLVIKQCPRITDSVVVDLAKLPGLESLDVSVNKGIQNRGLQLLPEYPALRSLNLSQTAITDAVLPTLRKLTGLKELEISHTRLLPADVDALKRELPNCKIGY